MTVFRINKLCKKIKTYFHNVIYRIHHNGSNCWKISTFDNGFELIKNGKIYSNLKWSDIKLIKAYNKDMLTYDSVCIVFVKKNGEFISVNEFDDGFNFLISKMEKKFPFIENSWFEKIEGKNAFEMNSQILWKNNSDRW